MEVHFHRQFKKQFPKFSLKIQKRFHERLALLLKEKHNHLLHVHNLSGSRRSYKSMNVTGDVRAVFQIKDNTVTFYEIGTHSELYK